MENYIVINGRKAELTKEQLKALGIVVKKDPFERAENNENFYCIDEFGDISMEDECHVSWDNKLYAVANYCTDKDLMQQRAYAETLNRLLWRYSEQHNEKEKVDEETAHYIYYDYLKNKWTTEYCFRRYHYPGEVFFDTEEIARSAIKEVVEPFMKEHPDFILKV